MGVADSLLKVKVHWQNLFNQPFFRKTRIGMVSTENWSHLSLRTVIQKDRQPDNRVSLLRNSKINWILIISWMVSGDPNLGIEMTLILKRRIINEVSQRIR